MIKIGADDFDKQFWVMSKVFLVRMVFLGAATVQILHSVFTYRYVVNKGLCYNITQRTSTRLVIGLRCNYNFFLLIIQGLRSAEPRAAPDAGGEGPGAGGERRQEGAVVRLRVGGGEHEGLLVGLRRAGRRGGQQDGPNIRPAAGGAVASNPKAQPNRRGGGDRRELYHNVVLPEVQPAATEIGSGLVLQFGKRAILSAALDVDKEIFIYTLV